MPPSRSDAISQSLSLIHPSDIEQYDRIWIEVANKGKDCVWSACAVDDTDDAHMGDNRDGDGQWYQYRTQGFCANAAYSLYGRRKDEVHSWWDNLLEGMSLTPVSFFEPDDDDNYDNAAADYVVYDDYVYAVDANDDADDDANDDGGDNGGRKLQTRGRKLENGNRKLGNGNRKL